MVSARSSVRLLSSALFAWSILVAVPAWAGVPLDYPCAITVFDNSIENGLGAESKVSSRDFCAPLVIPSECADQGYSLLGASIVNLTRISGSTTMSYSTMVRSGPLGGGFPTDVVSGPFPRTSVSIPDFPDFVADVSVLGSPPEPYWRVKSFDTDAALPSVCVRFTYAETAGRFLATDQSGTTPLSPCFTGTDGGAVDDPCATGSPSLRAAGLGLLVGRFGGPATEEQVVPPSGSSSSGLFLGHLSKSGDLSIHSQVWGMGEVTAMNIHQAPRGQNGPLLHTLANLPQSGTGGTSETLLSVGEAEIGALLFGNLYINVHTKAFPGGEIRGQLVPAADIFVDGFESGDTATWSVPNF